MILDKLILYCKRTNASIDTSYADAFLTITGVNINFNNNAGILSSMTQAQLYKASVLSGLKSMTWAEFSGLTMGATHSQALGNISETSQGLSGVGAMRPLGDVTEINALTPGVQLVPTVGSVVILISLR